jgi:hypothetical protein
VAGAVCGVADAVAGVPDAVPRVPGAVVGVPDAVPGVPDAESADCDGCAAAAEPSGFAGSTVWALAHRATAHVPTISFPYKKDEFTTLRTFLR